MGGIQIIRQKERGEVDSHWSGGSSSKGLIQG